MKKVITIIFAVLTIGISSCSFSNDEPSYPNEPTQTYTTDDDSNDTNGPKTVI